MAGWTHNTFGNDWQAAYNGHEDSDARDLDRGGKMRKTLTTIRCVPRYGYDHANVRTIDLELLDVDNERELLTTLQTWFAQHGIAEAVYATDIDDNGFFAIINDEAYLEDWGEPLL